MPYVQGPTPLSGPEGITPRINRAEPVTRTGRGDPQDRVDISEIARWKARLAEVPSIRRSLVDEVRATIEAGTYETEEKIRTAAEKILAELREEGAV